MPSARTRVFVRVSKPANVLVHCSCVSVSRSRVCGVVSPTFRKVNIVDTMFKMLEKYSTDLEEIVRVRTLALEEERKKTENLLSQMLPA